jgi:SOS-response transcriptional repressor LexA
MTKQQRDLLTFIDEFIIENGYSPSFREMQDALGLKSKSGVFRLLRGLEEQGRIRRLHYRKRALEVIKNPEIPLDLSQLSYAALAKEAKRRHLALCHIMRDDYGNRLYVPLIRDPTPAELDLASN